MPAEYVRPPVRGTKSGARRRQHSVWELRLRQGLDSDLPREQVYQQLGLDNLLMWRSILRWSAPFLTLLGVICLAASGKSAASGIIGTILLLAATAVLLGSFLLGRRVVDIADGRFTGDLLHPNSSRHQQARLPAADSVAHQPVRALRAAHELLMTVLPELDAARPGLREMSENTRLTLEGRARRIVLIERALAEFTSGSDLSEADAADRAQIGDGGYGTLRATLQRLSNGLQEGVSRYETLVARAVSASEASRSLELDATGATAAAEELAAWEAGMREIQQIARVQG